jgi:hypothetical protein
MDNPERYFCMCDYCLKQPKEIKGFPRYLIYSDGRVWSKFGKGRFLSTNSMRRGYKYVNLCNNSNDHFKYPIHRLVAEHFIYNPDDKPEVDHIDRNKSNNNVNNLRWVTKSENKINRNTHNMIGKTGHKYICSAGKRGYEVRFVRDKKYIGRRSFKNKIDAICYKYILLLKIKSNYYLNNGII